MFSGCLLSEGSIFSTSNFLVCRLIAPLDVLANLLLSAVLTGLSRACVCSFFYVLLGANGVFKLTAVCCICLTPSLSYVKKYLL